jgi:hypothetical protein
MAEAAREPGTAATLNLAALAALGLSLRPSAGADQPFEQTLFVSFRAEEFALVPWPQAQKDAFLHQQFRLQHHHFVTHSGSSINRGRPAPRRPWGGSISTVQPRYGT